MYEFWPCAQVISHVVIGLRTVKGTKQLKLDPTIYDALQKERVHPGDVIYIEANSGAGCYCLCVVARLASPPGCLPYA